MTIASRSHKRKTAQSRKPRVGKKRPRHRGPRAKRTQKQSFHRSGSSKICGLDEKLVHKLAKSFFGNILHHKQVLSLALVTLGVIHCTRMTVHAIGAALGKSSGKRCKKHGIKQVDRFMSNPKITPVKLREGLVKAAIGNRKHIEVSMDWTDFDKDDQTTLAISLILRKGRAIPLVWNTVKKSRLKNNQTLYERTCAWMLREALPGAVSVTLIADRGFGNTDFYDHLMDIPGFDFIIRFRQKIMLSCEHYRGMASGAVPRNGRIRVLHETSITAQRKGPYTVVLYKAAKMKDAWCLATNKQSTNGREIVTAYGHRFECEEGFRDIKDWRYGLALKHTNIRKETRREKLLFAYALAAFLLTIVGVESERHGGDRYIRANTEKRRTHSLFRQGREVIADALSEKLTKLILRAARRAIGVASTKGFAHVLS